MLTKFLSKQRILLLIIAILCYSQPQLILAGTYTVTNAPYYAKGDGVKNNLSAIQDAIDDAAADAPSTVVIPANGINVYLTGGAIQLKSGVTLQINSGVTLRGMSRRSNYSTFSIDGVKDYRLNMTHCALIFTRDASNVKITGGGTIEIPDYETVDGNGNKPNILKWYNCSNIRVENITLKNPDNNTLWTQLYTYSDSVVIDNVTVDNTGRTVATDDGIDIIACNKVWIMNSRFKSHDDAICLKSTSIPGYSTSRPTQNVHIINNIVTSMGGNSAGIKMGTETENSFSNIWIEGNHVLSAATAIVLEMVDGGTLENVTVKNIVIDKCEIPLYMRLGARNRTISGEVTPPVGRFRNVTIDGMDALNCSSSIGSAIAGVKYNNTIYKMQNIILRGLNIRYNGGVKDNSAVNKVMPDPTGADAYPESDEFGTLAAYGIWARYIDDFKVENCNITYANEDYRPAFVFDNVSNLTVDAVSYVLGQKSTNSTSNPAVWKGTVDVDKTLQFSNQGSGVWKIWTTGGATGSAPTVPGNLQATAISSSQINLSWTDNANNESRFRIESSTNDSTFSFLANVNSNITTYSVTGLSAGTTYYFRVRAENSVGNSAFINTAGATTSENNTTTWYKIKVVNNPTYVLNCAGIPANRTNVNVYSYNGGDEQLWQLVDVGSGYVKIVPRSNPNYCLDCSSTPIKGVNVQLWSYVGNTRQQWLKTDLGGGIYKISLKADANYVLDCSATPANSVNVQMWTYVGNDRQKWLLEPILKSEEIQPEISSLLSLTCTPTYVTESTVISYSISENALTSTVVYNMYGQKVKDFGIMYKQAGTYNITFYAADLKSGMYIIRLISGKTESTCKIMVK